MELQVGPASAAAYCPHGDPPTAPPQQEIQAGSKKPGQLATVSQKDSKYFTQSTVVTFLGA